MGNPDLIKNYVAGADITSYRLVKFAGDGIVVQADAAGDAIIGVSVGPNMDVPNGSRIDIVRSGIADIQYGGPVNAGDQLTTDADGKAVVAGSGNTVIGRAEESGVLDDIGRMMLQPA